MKARFFSRIVMLLLLSQATLACTLVPKVESTPPENLLFQDNFSNPSSGWDHAIAEVGSADYINGAYHIQVTAENIDFMATPGLEFNDVQIEVDASKIAGPDDNLFGVICRHQDANNYYFLVISSDGYYAIGKVIDGERTLIGTQGMSPSPLINLGGSLNHIRGDCVGGTLTLYVNGQWLASQQDDSLSTGDAGLMAGTSAIPGTEISFDNFIVLNP